MGLNFIQDETPRGHISGLIISNNGSDAAHDIDIAAGDCIGSANTLLKIGSSGITKQIDANWAEGDDAGGFPSGLTLTADTWYHVFVIKKNDGTIDAGYDTSTTATNLLSDATNYSEYRRIGSVRTDGSSNIYGFTQVGDEFLWDDPSPAGLDVDVSNPGATAVTRALTVPPDYKCHAIINVHYWDSTPSGQLLYISSLDQEDEAPSATAAPLCTVGSSSSKRGIHGLVKIQTNTSRQIRTRFDSSTANLDFEIATLGWVDARGKDV